MAVSNEVLASKLDAVIERLEKQDARFDAMDARFVLQVVYEPRMLALENKVNAYASRRWVQNTLSAILGAVLTTLIELSKTNGWVSVSISTALLAISVST
jgi:hypothetical protein